MTRQSLYDHSTNFSIDPNNAFFETAPMIVSFFSPFLKSMTVGMLRIPYWVAIVALSSVFSFKHFNLPAKSFDSSAITGRISVQGPHHSAQKSTSTGMSDSNTDVCHVSLVTSGTPALKSFRD